MTQYIDKCRVVAEIKERIDRDNERAASYPSNSEHDSFYRDRKKVYKSLLRFLDTLEVKEADLDFEKELYKAFGQVKDFTLGMHIAKHFFGLGIKAARKGK